MDSDYRSAATLKQAFCGPFWYETGANARSVHKATNFADRRYLYMRLFQNFNFEMAASKKRGFVEPPVRRL
jgi:hypothetical protein